MPWVLRDCTFFSARAPVPSTRLAPYMPDGFQPDADGQGQSRFGLRAWSCADGMGAGNQSTGPMAYASLNVPAHGPDELVADPEAGTFVKWRVVVPHAPTRQALVALGVDAVDGSVTVQATAAGTIVTVDIAGEGRFVLAVTTPSAAAQPFAGGTFDEFSPLTGGGVSAWRVSNESGDIAQAQGFLQVPEVGMAAEVFGARAVAVSVAMGTVSERVGQIEVPARVPVRPGADGP